MKNNITEFYITHLVPDLLPPKEKESLRKLLFYTATEKSYNEGKYYWGLDLRNPFDENHMKLLEKANKIIRLPGKVKVKKGEGLWLDADGKVYRANLKNPYESLKENDCFVFSPPQLSKAVQIYKTDIGTANVPVPNLAMSI